VHEASPDRPTHKVSKSTHASSGPHPASKKQLAKLVRSGKEEATVQAILEDEDRRIEVIWQFNTNPKKNISQLCEYYHVEPTPAGIAHLLRVTPGLLGDKIGDYLARPENVHILRAYFDDLDLKVDFVEAMRRSLSGPFFMPGEAQQVDRTMETLSNAYMQQNPGVFGSVDDAYVLAFALVMLNTDLLKPNVTHKMTCQEFIQNTSKPLEHSSITKDDLAHLYESLKTTPFAFSPVSDDFLALSAPKMKGHLKKMSYGFFGQTWKLFYFVLANSCLYYFPDNTPENKDKIMGMIQLVEVEVVPHKASDKRFVLRATGEQVQFVKFGKGPPVMRTGLKELEFEAPTKVKRDNWLVRLKKSAVMSCFQDGSGPPPSLDQDSDDGDAK
jgi:hypothetical protein